MEPSEPMPMRERVALSEAIEAGAKAIYPMLASNSETPPWEVPAWETLSDGNHHRVYARSLSRLVLDAARRAVERLALGEGEG